MELAPETSFIWNMPRTMDNVSWYVCCQLSLSCNGLWTWISEMLGCFISTYHHRFTRLYLVALWLKTTRACTLILETRFHCKWHVIKNVNKWQGCLISRFHREVDENCALLDYYAASGGSSFKFPSGATCRYHLQLQSLTVEDGTDRLSRNFGKELPHN